MDNKAQEETLRFIESEIQQLLRESSSCSSHEGEENFPPTFNNARQRLDVLRCALDRVSEGTHGVCVFCGRQLPVDTLTPSGHWKLCSTCAPYYARELSSTE